ncbi:MAG: DUF433 domain-containing protein [Spirochaetia bacterium]|nr:DUF433 domain-containing protein [Spirochaetia bacterium]
MDWRSHITSNPNICHGKPCIKGTRVMVSTILDNLANDIDKEVILKNYPSITDKDILAAIQYAADIANERIIEFA